MVAYDYPLLGIFWTMLWFFLWVAWIVLLFRVFADIFRSPDMSGMSKALWSVFVIALPLLGTFVYLVTRGHSMFERDAQEARARQDAVDDYIRRAAGTSASPADELAKLANLREQGVIDETEFQALKAKVLA